MSMKPPPPMLPASGSTTARANAVATAASTALPPRFKTSTPDCDASSSSVTTMPCGARTACLGQALFGSDGAEGLAGVCAATRSAKTAAQAANINHDSSVARLREIIRKNTKGFAWERQGDPGDSG